jgi:hypothetical protein
MPHRGARRFRVAVTAAVSVTAPARSEVRAWTGHLRATRVEINAHKMPS